MRIVFIIPTYNEADAIGELIFALESEFKKIPHHNFSILIVDANSPDGTANIVENFKNDFENIQIILEEFPSGLGSAYIKGMKFTMEKLNADAVFEFDGDFQHDPSDIPKFIREFDAGYDCIIGSRYISGGEIPREWSWYKRFLSKYGSLFIRKILNLPTRDNTSGFKLTRVIGYLEKLPLEEEKIFSRFHAYKIHLLYETIRLGAKVKEVPIKFLERKSGSSKSTARDISESLKVVFKIKMKEWKRKKSTT